jgi:WD40 repeat protein
MNMKKFLSFLCTALLVIAASHLARASFFSGDWVSLSSDAPNTVRAVITSEVEKVTAYSTLEEGEAKNRALQEEKEREDSATKTIIAELTNRFIQAKRTRDTISSRFAEKTNELEDYRKNLQTLSMQIQNLDSQNERSEKEIATQQEHLKKTLKTEKQGEALTAVIHTQGIRDKLYDLNRRADELSVPELVSFMGASIKSYTEVVGGVLSQDFIRSVSEGTAKPVNEEPVRIQLDVSNSGTKYLRVKRYELYPFQESGEAMKSSGTVAEKESVVIVSSIADLERLLSLNGYQIARYDTSRIRKLIEEVAQVNRLQNESLKDVIAAIQERITKQRAKIAEAKGDKERDIAKKLRVEETTNLLAKEWAIQKGLKEKAEAELAIVQEQLFEKKRVSDTIILKFALQASKGGQSPAEASIEAIIDKLDEVKNEARVQHSRETVEVTNSQLSAYEQQQRSTEARVTAVRLIAFTNEGSNGVRIRVAFRVRTVMSEVSGVTAAVPSSRPALLPASLQQKPDLKQAVAPDTVQKKGKKGRKEKKDPAKPVTIPGNLQASPPTSAKEQFADNKPVEERVPETSKTVAEHASATEAKPSEAPTSSVSEPFKSLTQHSNDVQSVTFSSDGSRAASGDRDNTVIVWDAHTWTPFATLKGHKHNVQALIFNSKGRQLTSGAKDQTVIIWDLATQKPLRTIKTDKDVTSIAYNPSGTHLAIGGKTNEIAIWDVASGTKSRTLKSGNDVFTLTYSPNGKLLAAAGKEKSVRLWNLAGTEEGRILEGHRNEISSLAFTPDGEYLASGGGDKSIIIWNVANGSVHKKLEGHTEKIVALVVTRDGRRLISADSQRSGGTIIIWDMKSGTILKRMMTQKKIEYMSLSPDGRLALVGSGKTLQVYRLD